ncbi:hypothetical protein IC840_002460, partial [Salmonella enterica]|nr:hypothetical protein [Salmonella enterica]
GAAFLCAELGIYGDLQHESYIVSWLQTLKEDNRAVFRAARFAREAFEYWCCVSRRWQRNPLYQR